MIDIKDTFPSLYDSNAFKQLVMNRINRFCTICKIKPKDIEEVTLVIESEIVRQLHIGSFNASVTSIIDRAYLRILNWFLSGKKNISNPKYIRKLIITKEIQHVWAYLLGLEYYQEWKKEKENKHEASN